MTLGDLVVESAATVEQFLRVRRDNEKVIVEPAAGQRGRGRGLAVLAVGILGALLLAGIVGRVAEPFVGTEAARAVMGVIIITILVVALSVQRRAARTVIEGDTLIVPGNLVLAAPRRLPLSKITGFEIAQSSEKRDPVSHQTNVYGAAWFLLEGGERVPSDKRLWRGVVPARRW